MTLVDSSVLVDYFNGVQAGHTEKLHGLLGKEYVALGDLILTEVLQGFDSEKDFKTAKRVLLSFPCYAIGGRAIALKSAENFRFLRSKGVTVRKTVDMLIGTFCLENGFRLLHNDKDFHAMSQHLGLKVAS